MLAGVPRAEVDACLGKPTLLVLAAEKGLRADSAAAPAKPSSSTAKPKASHGMARAQPSAVQPKPAHTAAAAASGGSAAPVARMVGGRGKPAAKPVAKPVAKPITRAEPDDGCSLEDMSFMKLKKWVIAQGVPREEADACFGKPALLQLIESKGLRRAQVLAPPQKAAAARPAARAAAPKPAAARPAARAAAPKPAAAARPAAAKPAGKAVVETFSNSPPPKAAPKAVRHKTPVAQVVPSKPKAAAKPADRRKVFQAEVVELLDSSDDEDGGPQVEVNVSTTHEGNKTIEVTVTTTYHDDGRVQELTSTKTTTRVQKAPEQSAAKPMGRAHSSPSHDLHDMSYMALKKWMKAQGVSCFHMLWFDQCPLQV